MHTNPFWPCVTYNTRDCPNADIYPILAANNNMAEDSIIYLYIALLSVAHDCPIFLDKDEVPKMKQRMLHSFFLGRLFF